MSKSLSHGVRASYGVGVVEAMEEMTTQYLEDCIKIANFIMPELLVILARQRRDYGLSIAFPAEFPIKDQASNIDDTPVSNMAMERICGLVDYRLHKLKQLEPVSRSNISQSTKTLRNNNESSYRSFAEAACHVKDIKLTWNNQMKEKFEKGTTAKLAISLQAERDWNY